MTLIDLARHRQGNRSRQNSPIACHSSQNGSFTFAGPGRRQRFQVREAKFIKEHDDCAELQRLFLSYRVLFTKASISLSSSSFTLDWQEQTNTETSEIHE